LGKNISIVKKT